LFPQFEIFSANETKLREGKRAGLNNTPSAKATLAVKWETSKSSRHFPNDIGVVVSAINPLKTSGNILCKGSRRTAQ
jgi:hypothetical protein